MFIKFCKDLIHRIIYSIQSSMYYAVSTIQFVLPFIALIIGMMIQNNNGLLQNLKEYYWICIIILILMLICKYIKWYSNKVGKGSVCPIPEKRFTEIDEDGLVSVVNDRLPEMLLYVADVEDYLEKEGLLK